MIELTAVKLIALIVATGLFVGLAVGVDGQKIGLSERNCEAIVALMTMLFIGLATAALVVF